MTSLPRVARVYVLSLMLLAALVAFGSLYTFQVTRSALLQVGLFATLICVSDLFPIVLRREEAEITVSVAVATTAVVLGPPPVTVLTVLLGTAAAEALQQRQRFKKWFNVAQIVVTYGLLSLTYQAVSDNDPGLLSSINDVLAVLLIFLGYYLLNTGLVSIAIAAASGVSVRYIWRVNFRDVMWHQLTMVPLGIVLAIMWVFHPLTIGLMVLPLLAVRQSFALAAGLRRQTRTALLAFADAIDARDPTTYQHSSRVAEYASLIARQLSLPEDEIELIRLSARLHDLGKVGVSDRWLFKPGPLASDERQDFERHPILGATIIDHFSLFDDGLPLIRHHHERYDGRGYPDGLTGEHIPLGARIIAVADAFDAMTSDRPYREALSADVALSRLRVGRGTQFDPRVVHAFAEALAPAAAPAGQETVAPPSMVVPEPALSTGAD